MTTSAPTGGRGDGEPVGLKLYSSPHSPFSTRVLIAARLKGVSLESAPPPAGGLKSSAFLAVNPIAKIPVLATEEGDFIPESEAILRYLEDRFPSPALMPCRAMDRARVNVAIRLTDAYLMDPVIRMFRHLEPVSRDRRVVDDELQRWSDGAAYLADWLKRDLPTAEAGLTLADCVLAPALHLGTRIAAILGLSEDPAQRHEALFSYRVRMARHPIVGPFLADLTMAQQAYDLKAGRPSIASWHEV